MSINKKIKSLLRKDKIVISKALGRFGRVVGVNLKACFPIKIKGINGEIGVTTFNKGDKVEIDLEGNEYVIKNI